MVFPSAATAVGRSFCALLSGAMTLFCWSHPLKVMAIAARAIPSVFLMSLLSFIVFSPVNSICSFLFIVELF
jgi:hypothetical protein